MTKACKKTIIVSLCLIMLFGVVGIGAVTASAASVDDLTYEINDRQVTITGCSKSASGELIIPETIDECCVTSISNGAFYGCTNLTSIVFPNSVTKIGFFYNCSALERITVSEDNPKYHSSGNCLIETASKSLVLGCKKSIIPNDGSVTTIFNGAFYGCRGLTSLSIPTGIQSIENWAFYNCSGLTSVIIPEGVTRIGSGAFEGCISLKQVSIPRTVNYIGDEAFSKCSRLNDITIPYGVLTIRPSTFYDCSTLTRVILPESITNIGSSAFRGCASLNSIYFPINVTTIGASAFLDSALTDVYYAGNANDKIEISIYQNNTMLLNAVWHYESSNPYTSSNNRDVSKTVITAPTGKKEINWKYRAELIATSANLPAEYHLAWFEGNNNVCDSNDFTTEVLSSTKTYTVKIVDKDGKIVSTSAQEKTVTIEVKSDFFSKLISFFLRLFGSDVTKI